MNSFSLSRVAAAILALTAVSAHAQVTISGAIDTAVESVNTGDTGGKRTQVNSGIATGSRVVFSMREDLGGGLSAFSRLDLGLRTESGDMLPGANTFFGRTSIVGIESKTLGQVAMGRTGTPLAPFLVQTDFAGLGYYGNNGSISQNIDGRASNGIFYQSPEMSGITLRAMATGPQNTTAPTDLNRMMGLGAYYRKGKLNLAAAHQTKVTRTGTGTNLAVDDQTETGLGGRYNFGWVTVNAGWYKIHQVTPSDAAARNTRASTVLPSENTTSYWLGAVFPVGKSGRLGMQMGETKGDVKRVGLPEPKGTTMSAYYSHSLSKRTSLYVNYARVDNNEGSRLTLAPVGLYATVRPQNNGSDPSAFALGILHTF
jgi:predicted porin